MTPTTPDENDLEKRIPALRNAVEADPARASAPLAEAYRLSGRPEEALEAARRGVDADPGHLGIRIVLARALADTGDREGALVTYGLVLERDPGNAEARAFVSSQPEPAPNVTSEHESDAAGSDVAPTEAAEPVAKEPETWEPEDAEPEVLEADVGEPEVAEPVAGEPAMPGSEFRTGGATGSLSEELAHLADLFVPSAGNEQGEPPELGPTSIATLTLAEIYSRQGLPEKAAEVCERILEREPGNEKAREALGQYRERLAAAHSEHS